MYDSDTGTVTSALQGSSTAVFTDNTIARILALTTNTTGGDTKVTFATGTPDANGNVTVPAGAEVVYVTGSDTQQTTIKAPVNAPVVIFQGRGGVIATINDGPTTVPAHAAGVVDRVVVGTAGNDKIVVADAKNSDITLGSGNSTVVAGGGEDTIHAGLGNSTISGGTGHAIVTMSGTERDYQVTVTSDHHALITQFTHTGGTGHAIGEMTGIEGASHGAATNSQAASAVVNNVATDITKIQYVQLDGGKALVLANNSTEAAVADLYQAAFGRTADANGLKYWFDAAKAGATMTDIANGFTHSAEFQATAAATASDGDFIAGLYMHTFNRVADSDGVAYWTTALQSGATRAQLIASFADIAAHNTDGTIHTEAVVVGSVTIVTGIV